MIENFNLSLRNPSAGRHPQSLESAITVDSIYPGAPTGLPSD
jgi:hypothetical protein